MINYIRDTLRREGNDQHTKPRPIPHEFPEMVFRNKRGKDYQGGMHWSTIYSYY